METKEKLGRAFKTPTEGRAQPSQETKAQGQRSRLTIAKLLSAVNGTAKEKAAGLTLEEGTNSTLKPLAAGGLSKTPEAFNAWLHAPESVNNLAQNTGAVNDPVRYALDLRGRAYGDDKRHVLAGFTAAAALTESP